MRSLTLAPCPSLSLRRCFVLFAAADSFVDPGTRVLRLPGWTGEQQLSRNPHVFSSSSCTELLLNSLHLWHETALLDSFSSVIPARVCTPVLVGGRDSLAKTASSTFLERLSKKKKRWKGVEERHLASRLYHVHGHIFKVNK